jgi:cell division protease FtsH
MFKRKNEKPAGKSHRRHRKDAAAGWKSYLSWFLLPVVLIVFFLVTGSLHGSNIQPISWDQFEKNILDHQAADSIEVINGTDAEIYIRPVFADSPWFRPVMKPVGSKAAIPGPQYSVSIGSPDLLMGKLDETQRGLPAVRRTRVNFVKRGNGMGDLLSWLLPIAAIILFVRLARSGGAGGFGGTSPFSFSKSTAVLQTADNKSAVTFKDVAGLREAKEEVAEIVDFLRDPSLYTRLGAKIPRGVMLVGPPGTGKTLLAKAVAGEADVPFFSLSGSEFVEMFVGVGASRVRDLFRQAKEQAPAIIFIDEIDAVGRSRSHNAFYSGSNDERENTLNQLLTEMDGFGTNSGVIVLAATNRGDMLDPALLRPGRFDRHIYLELPDLIEREEIFRVYLRPLTLGEPIDAHFLASQTPGFSGADIANICNEAALFAARRKSAGVEKRDFFEAIDRIVAGLEKKSRIISPAEKKLIAFHEAGHAVASWYLPLVDPLIKVSVIPRGRSLGAAWYLPEEKQIRTSAAFRENLSAALGGRAAEQLVFGEVSSGALDDLEKVTKEAYRMVAYYGFDKKLGNISFYDSTASAEASFQKPYSEATGRLIDEQVRQLVTDAYSDGLALLTQHRAQLNALAGLLLQKEVVDKEQLDAILGKREAVTVLQSNGLP